MDNLDTIMMWAGIIAAIIAGAYQGYKQFKKNNNEKSNN